MTNTKICDTLDAALFEFQKTFDGVDKVRTNPFTNSLYASLDDIVHKAIPALSEVGISVSYPLRILPAGDGYAQMLLCKLLHVESGEFSESTIMLPDPSDGAQNLGSYLTYYRRYLLCCALNIVETEDDDGNATVETTIQLLTEKQHSEILDFVEATGTNMGDADTEGTLLHHVYVTMNISSIENMTSKQASTILKMLKSKYKRQQAEK